MPAAPGADKTDLAPFGMLPESQMEEGQDLRLNLVGNLTIRQLQGHIFNSGTTSTTSGSVLPSSFRPSSSIFQGNR